MSVKVKTFSTFALWILALSAARAQDAPLGLAVPAAPAPKAEQIEAGEPRVNTSNAAATPIPAATHPLARKSAKAAKAADKIELDTTTVTGNRELPKVMYVVPWKKSDIGDLVGKPMNSLLDEVLAPVDRDVFRREVMYYQAVKADAVKGEK